MDSPKTYVYIRTPGHVCAICGADISHRAACTKHCSDCRKKLELERYKEERALHRMLVFRDTACAPLQVVDSTMMRCRKCLWDVYADQIFCDKCGQRLKEV